MLEYKQMSKLMEQNRCLHLKYKQLHSPSIVIYFTNVTKIHTRRKTASLMNGTGKTGFPHIEKLNWIQIDQCPKKSAHAVESQILGLTNWQVWAPSHRTGLTGLKSNKKIMIGYSHSTCAIIAQAGVSDRSVCIVAHRVPNWGYW